MFKSISSFIKLKPALAVGFLFSISSLLFGIWVASIPLIKERMGFSDGSLGLSLLLAPLGSITGMLLSTRIFSKIPVGKWLVGGYFCSCIVMILQVNAVNRIMLWICLYLFGTFGFLNGVSSNATVNILEKKYNRLLMSTCHGMYSLGGAVSAAVAAILFIIGLPSSWQIIIVTLCIITVLFFNRKLLLANNDVIHSRSGIKLPSLSILGISFICMSSFMAEGCVADWSGIYLKETLLAPKAFVSLGYAGFSVAMTLGRLNGDSLISKLGSKKIVIAGCMLAALGFLTVVSATVVPVAIAGYVLVGFGCCCTVPVLFRASANIPGVSTVEGFAMVTTGGLIGFLAGPSLIGFISEKTNLSTALSLLILMALLSGFVAWKNKFLGTELQVEPELPFDEQLY